MPKSSLGSLIRILAGTLQRKGGSLYLYRHRVMGHTVQALWGSGTNPCCPPAPAGPRPHTASPWMLWPRLSVFSKWTGGLCPGLKADSILHLSHLGIISALQRDWLSFVAWSFSLCFFPLPPLEVVFSSSSFLELHTSWFPPAPPCHSSHNSHCSLSVIYSLHFSGQS